MKIDIYTRQVACQWCDNAKYWLTKKGYKYNEIVIGQDIERDEFVNKFWPDLSQGERPTVPQIVIDGEWIGGFDHLMDWLRMKGTDNVE